MFVVPERAARNTSTTILALHEDLFRGDLETIAELPDTQVLSFSVRWQQILVDVFYGKRYSIIEYYQAEKDSPIFQSRQKSRKFIEKVLRRVTSVYSVDAVLSPNMRHIEDLDWSYAAKKIGSPSILLFREGLINNERAYQGVVIRQRQFGKFIGTHIMVHNQAIRDAFVESEFVSENDISIVGIPRMDRLCRLIEAEKASRRDDNARDTLKSGRAVLILYFPPGRYQTGFWDGNGLWRPPGVPHQLFEDFFKAIFELAEEHPDIEFLVKPKKGDLSISHFYNQCEKQKVDLKRLTNIVITESINVHSAIMKCRVVCGLQTTSILEAALAGRTVILPYFSDYRDSQWSERFGYRKYLSAFTVPSDSNQLKKEVLNGLKQSEQPEPLMLYRQQLFSTWLSSPNGTAASKCVEGIRFLVSERQKTLSDQVSS